MSTKTEAKAKDQEPETDESSPTLTEEKRVQLQERAGDKVGPGGMPVFFERELRRVGPFAMRTLRTFESPFIKVFDGDTDGIRLEDFSHLFYVLWEDSAKLRQMKGAKDRQNQFGRAVEAFEERLSMGHLMAIQQIFEESMDETVASTAQPVDDDAELELEAGVGKRE